MGWILFWGQLGMMVVGILITVAMFIIAQALGILLATALRTLGFGPVTQAIGNYVGIVLGFGGSSYYYKKHILGIEDTSLWVELASAAAMMGWLKMTSSLFTKEWIRRFGSIDTHARYYKIGAFTVSYVSFNIWTEFEHLARQGRWMDGSERAQAYLVNFLTLLVLASVQTEWFDPLQKSIDAMFEVKGLGGYGKLSALGESIAELKASLKEKIDTEGEGTSLTEVMEILPEIQLKELEYINELENIRADKSNGLSGTQRTGIKEIIKLMVKAHNAQMNMFKLVMAKAGLSIESTSDLVDFVATRPGEVAYGKGGKEVLDIMIKELNKAREKSSDPSKISVLEDVGNGVYVETLGGKVVMRYVAQRGLRSALSTKARRGLRRYRKITGKELLDYLRENHGKRWEEVEQFFEDYVDQNKNTPIESAKERRARELEAEMEAAEKDRALRESNEGRDRTNDSPEGPSGGPETTTPFKPTPTGGSGEVAVAEPVTETTVSTAASRTKSVVDKTVVQDLVTNAELNPTESPVTASHKNQVVADLMDNSIIVFKGGYIETNFQGITNFKTKIYLLPDMTLAFVPISAGINGRPVTAIGIKNPGTTPVVIQLAIPQDFPFEKVNDPLPEVGDYVVVTPIEFPEILPYEGYDPEKMNEEEVGIPTKDPSNNVSGLDDFETVIILHDAEVQRVGEDFEPSPEELKLAEEAWKKMMEGNDLELQLLIRLRFKDAKDMAKNSYWLFFISESLGRATGLIGLQQFLEDNGIEIGLTELQYSVVMGEAQADLIKKAQPIVKEWTEKEKKRLPEEKHKDVDDEVDKFWDYFNTKVAESYAGRGIQWERLVLALLNKAIIVQSTNRTSKTVESLKDHYVGAEREYEVPKLKKEYSDFVYSKPSFSLYERLNRHDEFMDTKKVQEVTEKVEAENAKAVIRAFLRFKSFEGAMDSDFESSTARRAAVKKGQEAHATYKAKIKQSKTAGSASEKKRLRQEANAALATVKKVSELEGDMAAEQAMEEDSSLLKEFFDKEKLDVVDTDKLLPDKNLNEELGEEGLSEQEAKDKVDEVLKESSPGADTLDQIWLVTVRNRETRRLSKILVIIEAKGGTGTSRGSTRKVRYHKDKDTKYKGWTVEQGSKVSLEDIAYGYLKSDNAKLKKLGKLILEMIKAKKARYLIVTVEIDKVTRIPGVTRMKEFDISTKFAKRK